MSGGINSTKYQYVCHNKQQKECPDGKSFEIALHFCNYFLA